MKLNSFHGSGETRETNLSAGNWQKRLVALCMARQHLTEADLHTILQPIPQLLAFALKVNWVKHLNRIRANEYQLAEEDLPQLLQESIGRLEHHWKMYEAHWEKFRIEMDQIFNKPRGRAVAEARTSSPAGERRHTRERVASVLPTLA